MQYFDRSGQGARLRLIKQRRQSLAILCGWVPRKPPSRLVDALMVTGVLVAVSQNVLSTLSPASWAHDNHQSQPARATPRLPDPIRPVPTARDPGNRIGDFEFASGGFRVVRCELLLREPKNYLSNSLRVMSINSLSVGFIPNPAACPQMEGIGRSSAFGIISTSSWLSWTRK
jgi:hypothetical protein